MEGRLLLDLNVSKNSPSQSSCSLYGKERREEGRTDVVVRKGAAVLELLAGEDETLLVRGDTLLVLDLGLDVVNGVRGLNLEAEGARERRGWRSALSRSSARPSRSEERTYVMVFPVRLKTGHG